MGRRLGAAIIAAILCMTAMTISPAAADDHATTVASFEDTVAPEGIIVGDDGTVYVSTAGGGQIWRLDSAGEPTVVATIDDAIPPEAFGVLGLWLEGDTIYAAAMTFNPDTHGVWAVDVNDGSMNRVPGSEAAGIPNSVIVVDGVIYFTDSTTGGVWSQSGTDPAEPWIVDSSLAGTGALLGPDAPIGANGIAHHDGTIYVANTEGASVVAIPIESDGSAGTPTAVSDPALAGIDGIATDDSGTIYGVILRTASLVTIGLDGTITEVAGLADGLDSPSSVAVGPDGLVYVVNFSVGELFGFPGVAGPGVARVDPSAVPVAVEPTTPAGDDRDVVAYSSANQEIPDTGSSAWAWSVFRVRENGAALSFSTTVFDIEAPITAAHLHWAPRGENGPVVANLTDMIVDDTRLSGTITADVLADVLEGADVADLVAEIDAGNIYLNIHTEGTPSGEIRGQLVEGPPVIAG